MRAKTVDNVFDVLTWSKRNLTDEIFKNIYGAHTGKFGEKVQTSLLKCQNKNDILKWHNRTFEIGLDESLNFEEDLDPYKALKIGNTAINKDPEKRLENFRNDNSAAFAWNSTSHLKAPGKHPVWQVLNINVSNSQSELQDNVNRYLKWVHDNTDFDIIELESSYERDYLPGFSKSKKRVYDQGITIKMRNYEDTD